MPMIVITCPHCSAEKMTFDVISCYQFSGNQWHVFCKCRGCNDTLIAKLQLHFSTPPQTRIDLIQGNLLSGPRGPRLLEVIPPEQKPTAPQYTPSRVADHFIEGLKVLKIGAYPSAGNSFRRTLEKACQHLDPDDLESTLFERINKLYKDGVITQSIYEWAEIIRKWGNWASHGDHDFTESTAKELQRFAEYFLVYVFTLPQQVKDAREASTVQENAET